MDRVTSNEVANYIRMDHSKLLRKVRKLPFYKECDFFLESCYKDKNNQKRPNFLINKEGCLALAKTLRGSKQIKMYEFIKNRFRNLYVDVFLPERKEILFLDKLKEALKPFKLTLEQQTQFSNYRLDGYIPNLNLAIEYDELEHESKREQDEERQRFLEREYGLSFVRVRETENDDYNVGLVLKKIMEEIK